VALPVVLAVELLLPGTRELEVGPVLRLDPGLILSRPLVPVLVLPAVVLAVPLAPLDMQSVRLAVPRLLSVAGPGACAVPPG
jgi:hypothetical protein